jgi:hypothetical protein
MASGCALALAACGGDEKTVETVVDVSDSPRLEKAVSCVDDKGYTADVRAVDSASRRAGATGAFTVLLDVESGTAVDNLVEVYYWDSKSDATRYASDVSAGPGVDLHHEQFGTVTITHIEHSHDEHHAEDPLDQSVEAIAACVA